MESKKSAIIISCIVLAFFSLAFSYIYKNQLSSFFSREKTQDPAAAKPSREQKKYYEKIEKLKGGYSEAVLGYVLDVKLSEGKFQVRTDQLEENITVEVLFGNRTEITQLRMVGEQVPDPEEAGQTVTANKEEISKAAKEDIKEGSYVQVISKNLFMPGEASSINAAKIMLIKLAGN